MPKIEFSYSLMGDGSSDRALLPILDGLLREKLSGIQFRSSWVDLGYLRKIPKGLAGRMRAAADLYPSELLFVHRDCEGDDLSTRRAEIERARQVAFGNGFAPRVVSIVPKRMMEAWLLVSERAIRSAAGNPNGQRPLQLPPIRKLEAVSDPKEILFSSLRVASGLNQRRAKELDVHAAVHQIAERIEDFQGLRTLPAFVQFEKELDAALVLIGVSPDLF